MSKITPENIREKAEKYRDYATRALSELIRIRSFSGQEEEIVNFLQREFAACGAGEVTVDNFGNVLARLGNRGPVIAFDAHIDTVDIGQPERWSFDPFCGDIRDGRVLGRGAADQKAGMASMLAALKILSESSTDLPFTLFFVGSVLEEDCDGLCWQYIVNEDKIVPDIVILTEPTGGKINRGHRGRMEIEIMVSGVACHGSAPERGQNAIYRLAPIIKAVENLNGNLADDPFLGKGTVAATRIRSNAPSLNAVADLACLYLDRRLTRGETPMSARAELEALMEVQQAGARIEIPVFEKPSWRGTTYPTSKSYPTWLLPENHHLIDYAGRCHQRLFGSMPLVDKWIFSTNGVATMGLANIPTFGFGPGNEEMAHAADESVAVDDLVRCAAFYAYFPWIVVGQ
ncbi:MAG: selenium metabolism hydrolase [candidate division Zixibacteria bacterium RBG_16_53_22]|nr:MAG: selenium metabolism hydrolase [candidate division Zixibacteria bacterium RBG_16_53_22]